MIRYLSSFFKSIGMFSKHILSSTFFFKLALIFSSILFTWDERPPPPPDLLFSFWLLFTFPRSSYFMNSNISDFSMVPEPSRSKVMKTSRKASSENSSSPPTFPILSFTNYLVSSKSRSPLPSMSYWSHNWSMDSLTACSSLGSIFTSILGEGDFTVRCFDWLSSSSSKGSVSMERV